MDCPAKRCPVKFVTCGMERKIFPRDDIRYNSVSSGAYVERSHRRFGYVLTNVGARCLYFSVLLLPSKSSWRTKI